MEIAFQRDDAQRVLRLVASGPFDTDEVMRVLVRMRREDVWGYGVLFDLRAVTTIPAAAELATISDAVLESSANELRGPLALLVPDGELHWRAYAYFALGAQHGRVIRVFRHLDDAEQWLASTR